VGKIRQEGLGMSLRASDPLWNFRGVDAVDSCRTPSDLFGRQKPWRIHENPMVKIRVIWILWDIDILVYISYITVDLKGNSTLMFVVEVRFSSAQHATRHLRWRRGSSTTRPMGIGPTGS
jgi:hypothetical protein